MSDDLTLWPLQEAIASAADPHNTGEPLAVAGVLVLYRPMLESSVADAQAVSEVIAKLARDNDRARALGEATPGRFLHKPVGVLEVGEISPDQTARLSSAWAGATSDLPTPLWTSAGRDMLERFAPGASTAAIVIDAQQRLVAVIPLDGRGMDASLVVADVTAALTKAWSGSR
jgi:hypothetical protein